MPRGLAGRKLAYGLSPQQDSVRWETLQHHFPLPFRGCFHTPSILEPLFKLQSTLSFLCCSVWVAIFETKMFSPSPQKIKNLHHPVGQCKFHV